MSHLVVLGSGITFYSHLTSQAKATIDKAEIVLYLAIEPALEQWICQRNKNSISLYPFYTKYTLRIDCYNAIVDKILDTLCKHEQVCVVFYGHPSVFADPAINAVTRARQNGHQAEILPGISAEDCLFADLLINPGSCGCLSFEATDFLVRQRQFSTTSHLILWQVGLIGALGKTANHNNSPGITALFNRLSVKYKQNHGITIYEAAQYATFEPRIEHISLKYLLNSPLSDSSTLYIPPTKSKSFDQSMLHTLGIDSSML